MNIIARLRAHAIPSLSGTPENRAAFLSAADRIEKLEAALRRIADMTDIEADFDGFEARGIARDTLAKIGGEA